MAFISRTLDEAEISNQTESTPFLRACGPFRGGGSESDSDFEPDWDSEPDNAGRGFSSSESLSTTFFSDPDPDSESEADEAFCNIKEKKRIWTLRIKKYQTTMKKLLKYF